MSAAALPTAVNRGKAMIATVHQYYLNHARAAKLEAENKDLKDQIVEAMGGEPVTSCGAHIVRVTETAGTPGKPNVTITKDMIGVVIIGSKGRAGSTKLEVI